MTFKAAAVGASILILSPLNANAGTSLGLPIKIAAEDSTSSESDAPTPLGRCGVYVSVDGSARIVRVEQTATSSAQASESGGPGYAGYEVWFGFTPDKPVAGAETEKWVDKEHELLLANSWYPGPEFIKKYGLKTGDTIPAVLKVQTSGPCTPFVFDFPTVDTTDYFESAR